MNEEWMRLAKVEVTVSREVGKCSAFLHHFGKEVTFEWAEREASGKGRGKKVKNFKRKVRGEGETKEEAIEDLFFSIRGKTMVTAAQKWNTPWALS